MLRPVSEPLPHDGGGALAQHLVTNDQPRAVSATRALLEAVLHHLDVVQHRHAQTDQAFTERLVEIAQTADSSAQLRQRIAEQVTNRRQAEHKLARGYLERRLTADVVLRVLPALTKEKSA